MHKKSFDGYAEYRKKVFSLKQNMHNVILKNDKTMMG